MVNENASIYKTNILNRIVIFMYFNYNILNLKESKVNIMGKNC